MRRTLLFLCALALAVMPLRSHGLHRSPGGSGGPGALATGWRDVTVPRITGGSFVATLYYPASHPGGLNALVDVSAGPYSAVAFGHGFQQDVATYSSTLRHLASWGFVVIAPRSYEDSVLPSHSRFADDLRDGLTYLADQTAAPASPLFQAVDVTRFGVSGHSMGGGAALIAADRDQRILAVATLAAAETSPSAIAAVAGITRPVQLTSGSQDAIVPPAANQVAQFNAANAPRQAPTIIGGFHCGFQDYSDFAFFCDSGGMTRTLQISITKQLLTEWFMLYLRGDAAQWVNVWGPPGLNRPKVQLAADDGIALEPGVITGAAQPGQFITYTFAVTNAQAVTNSYALSVEGAGTLTATTAVTQTPLVGTGGVTTFGVTTHGAQPGDYGLTLTVRSLFDGGTTDWANITTTVMSTPPMTFTPAVTVSVPFVPKDTPP